MTYEPKKKGTVLIPSGPRGDTRHLFVILTDKCDKGYHLIANLTTVQPHMYHDPTCEIRAGEHPWVRHDSFIMYGMIEVIKSDKLIDKVDGGEYPTRADVSDGLFSRIRNGIMKSRHTKQVARDYYKKQLDAEANKAVPKDRKK